MKTSITFINIKQYLLQSIIQLYNPQSVQCPGAHCTALALNYKTNTLNNLNAVIVKRNWKLVSSEWNITKQAVGGRPPRYAPPLSSHVGAEAPRAAEQTAT